MNDAVFNTLAAVVLMCSNHFHGVLNPPDRVSSGYDPGFEQCAVISKELEAERARRAKEHAEKLAEADKARVANAMAALHGKPFKEEAVPPVLNSSGSPWCSNLILTH
jgi:hypothetical protein